MSNIPGYERLIEVVFFFVKFRHIRAFMLEPIDFIDACTVHRFYCNIFG